MYPWAEYKGWVFPNTPPMKEKGAEKHFQDLRNFKSRETDILMCSQMRTGNVTIISGEKQKSSPILYICVSIYTSNKL